MLELFFLFRAVFKIVESNISIVPYAFVNGIYGVIDMLIERFGTVIYIY